MQVVSEHSNELGTWVEFVPVYKTFDNFIVTEDGWTHLAIFTDEYWDQIKDDPQIIEAINIERVDMLLPIITTRPASK